eukprot:m.117930 g.117930  ORF g.117930 m.117930 type:complete len:114 (+) comp19488_c0_seq4:1135-1476(+)
MDLRFCKVALTGNSQQTSAVLPLIGNDPQVLKNLNRAARERAAAVRAAQRGAANEGYAAASLCLLALGDLSGQDVVMAGVHAEANPFGVTGCEYAAVPVRFLGSGQWQFHKVE